MSRAKSATHTYRVTFESSDEVERIKASSYRSVPRWVEFVVEEATG